tara:strand:+ start:11907 stop:12104 length:198 start_codon:yes stop_codon:yes gene_type:complete
MIQPCLPDRCGLTNITVPAARIGTPISWTGANPGLYQSWKVDASGLVALPPKKRARAVYGCCGPT